MFEHIGRHPDRGYAIRQLIAIVIGVTTAFCTGTTTLFVWLGWKAFWLLVALVVWFLHILFPSVPLMDLAFLEEQEIVVLDVVIEEQTDDWLDAPLLMGTIVEMPDDLPVIPEPEPEVLRRVAVMELSEAPREMMLLSIIGTVGNSDGAVMDVLSSGDVFDLSDAFADVGGIAVAEGSGVAELQTGGGAAVATASNKPALVKRGRLRLEGSGECRVWIIIETSGRGFIDRYGDCPDHARTAVAEAVADSRWERPASETSVLPMTWTWHET